MQNGNMVIVQYLLEIVWGLSVFTNISDLSQARLQLLAARGVQIGIDHYGTLGTLGIDYRASTPLRRMGEKWEGVSSFPLPSQLGGLGERRKVSSPSRVRDGAPAEINFYKNLNAKEGIWWHVFCWIFCLNSI